MRGEAAQRYARFTFPHFAFRPHGSPLAPGRFYLISSFKHLMHVDIGIAMILAFSLLFVLAVLSVLQDLLVRVSYEAPLILERNADVVGSRADE